MNIKSKLMSGMVGAAMLLANFNCAFAADAVTLPFIKVAENFVSATAFTNAGVERTVGTYYSAYDGEAVKFDGDGLPAFTLTDDYFGLFYKDELIYVVSLKNKQYIVQECVKLNTFVENGLIKLIDFIIAKNNTPIFIEIDRRLQNVEFYKSCGFEKVFESEPNYFYVFGYNREKEISKLAENYRFSEEETRRIYDCGYIKMKFSK